MTYQSIPGAPASADLNLAVFNETVIPIGSKIRCIVTAAGQIDDPVWGPIDGSIEHITNAIEIKSATTSNSPRFEPDTLLVSLNPAAAEGSASIVTTGDLSDTRVEWETVESDYGTGDARFFQTMKPVVHWLDPGWEDYNVSDVVTVRLAAEHAHGIEKIEFTTTGLDPVTVTTRDSDGYFSHTYVQPSGEAVTTATVTPNTAGVPMVMAGNTNIDDAVGDQDGLVLGGIRGFVTYGGRTVDVVTVSDQAGLVSALAALADPVGNHRPTIININTPGVYYLADGNGDPRQISTNGWVIIRGIVDGVQFANQYDKCVVVGQTISDRIRNSYTYEFQALGFENVEFIQEGRSVLNYGINASTNDPFFKEQLISLAPDISRRNTFKTKLYYKNCVFTGCVEYNPVLAKDAVDEDENGTPIIDYSEARSLPDPSDPPGDALTIGGAAGVNYELKPNSEEREFDISEPNFMLPDTPVLDDWIDSNDAKWVIDCTADKMGVGSPIRGRQKQYVLVRNIQVGNVADDILTNAACCLDINIENFNGGGNPPSPMHSDLWQAYTNLLDGRVYGNILLKNITCWMAWEDDGDAKKGAGQAIFCDGNWGGGVDGFVVMDCEIACSVGTVKLEFRPEEQTIKNMVFSDSSLLRAGDRWSGPTFDAENPSYGDVLFRNCTNGKSNLSGIYVPGVSRQDDEYDDNPFMQWVSDGIPVPYWSPMNVHILGDGDEFALTQGDGIPEGNQDVFVDGWVPDMSVSEEIAIGTDASGPVPVIFYAPYDVPVTTFLGVAGAIKIGLTTNELNNSRLGIFFESTGLANNWLVQYNNNYDAIIIRDSSGNEHIFSTLNSSFTPYGPTGATFLRLIPNESAAGSLLYSILGSGDTFTVEGKPKS